MGIGQVEIDAYRVPTEEPESDGTLDWDATTVVVVRVHAEGKTGLGFTYATSACVPLIADVLAPVVLGADPMTPTAAWAAMN